MTALAEELLVENSPELNPQVEEKQEQLKERISAPCHDRPWNFYFGPTGDFGRVLTKKQALGFHYDSAGALAGFDYAFSDLGVGFLFDYDHIDGRVDEKWGKFNVDQTHGSLYVTYIRAPEPQLSFNLILGGGYEWYNIRRNAGTGVARGMPQGVEFDALAGMEYTIEKERTECMADHWQVVPLVNLQYIYLHVNNYREHGAGGFDLQYHSQNVRSLRSTLGTRINYSWEWTNVVFKPEINLGWQWEFFDKNRHLGLAGPGFATNLLIAQPGRNVALAGIDFLVTLFDKYGVEASYDFEWNERYLDHFFYLGCNFRF
jgi:outer membrane autotransporter protein